VLAIGGATQAAGFPAASIRNVASDVRERIYAMCGHWPQLEKPEQRYRATHLSVRVTNLFRREAMITETLRENQLSDAATSWYVGEYLNSMDQLDIERYATFLAEDVRVQFNNDAPIEGKPAVVEMLGGYWKSFKTIEHELLNIYGSDDRFTLEANNHYTRHDGRKVTTRAVAFTDRDLAAK
jgi:ketosteroid isomerase-like protein